MDATTIPGQASVDKAGVRPAFAIQVAILATFLVIFMTVVITLITPVYQTIDDMIMHEYVAGLFFTRPDSHMLYTHFVLGKILSSLYTMAAGVAWYPLYQMLALFGSSLVICATFVRLYGFRQAILPTLAYAFGVLAPVCISIQFTTTASIVGIAGGVLLFSALEERSQKYRRLLIAASVATIVCASLIRQQAVWMVLVVLVLTAVVKYFASDWKKLGLSLAVVTLMFGLTHALWVANDSYYKQTGWGEFETWRKKLIPLYDFSRLDLKGPSAADTLKVVGWSANDARMLNTCLHWDRNVFSTEKIIKLGVKGQSWFRPDLKTYLPGALRTIIKDPVALIVLSMLLASLLVKSSPILPFRRFLVLTAAVFAIGLAVTMTKKFAMHVNLPLLYMLAVARLASFDLETIKGVRKSIPDGPYVAVPFLACLVFFAMSLDDHFKSVKRIMKTSVLRRQQMQAIHDNYPEKLAYTVVGAPSLFPYENTEPLRDLKIVSPYSSRNNFGKTLLAAHGIKDFGEGLVSGKVLVISNETQNQLLGTYFKEHYGLTLRFNRLPCSGSAKRAGIYDVRTEGEPTSK